MSKHTPGPWTWDATRSRLQCQGGHVIEYAPYEGMWFARYNEEDEANKDLMAAAPELLEALEAVVQISDRDHEAWHRAKAAIARARGERKCQ